MSTYIQRFVVFILLALVGIGIFGSGEVYATPGGGGFDVPQVDDQFDKFEKDPAPKKAEPLNQDAQEEGGAWDWIKEKVTGAWEWTTEIWDSFQNKREEYYAFVNDPQNEPILEQITEFHKKQMCTSPGTQGVAIACLASLGIEKLTGFDPLGELFMWAGKNPEEALFTYGMIALSFVAPQIGIPGLVGEAATGSVIAGGGAGLISGFVYRQVAKRLATGRFAAWLGGKVSPWVQRLAPDMIGGGAAGVTDSMVFDWLKGKAPSIKKAAISGFIGLSVVLGGGGALQKKLQLSFRLSYRK